MSVSGDYRVSIPKQSTFFSLFPKKVDHIITGYRDRMGSACVMIMNDAQDVEPSTPIDTGATVSSYSVFVDNELVAISDYRGGVATPILSHRNNPDPKREVVGTVLVGTWYSDYIHDPRNNLVFKRPGAGSDFLGSKLRNASKYYEEVSKGFSDAGRRT